MSKIKVNGAKDLMAVLAPKLAALVQGDWVQVNDHVRIKVPQNTDMNVAASNGVVTVTFPQPLPVQVFGGWGPCQGKFSGTIDGVLEITQTGAKLALGSLPDQLLEWAP
jgi:hypothetical protein